LIAGGEYGTALGAASYNTSYEIVELLLEKGADPFVPGACLTKEDFHIL
jgi:hypothetical protein